MSTFDNLKTGCKPDKHWGLTTCQPIFKKNTVNSKIVLEKKPALKTLSQYKAGTMHPYTVIKRTAHTEVVAGNMKAGDNYDESYPSNPIK